MTGGQTHIIGICTTFSRFKTCHLPSIHYGTKDVQRKWFKQDRIQNLDIVWGRGRKRSRYGMGHIGLVALGVGDPPEYDLKLTKNGAY